MLIKKKFVQLIKAQIVETDAEFVANNISDKKKTEQKETLVKKSPDKNQTV
jgi:hypothetical protein